MRLFHGLAHACSLTRLPNRRPMRGEDFTLAKGEGEKQVATKQMQQKQQEEGAKGKLLSHIIDAIEDPANGAKPGEPTS